MEKYKTINQNEIYTISLYRDSLNYSSTLEIVSTLYELGDLKNSINANSILRIELELATGDIASLFRHLTCIEDMDKEFNRKIYAYEVNNLNYIKEEVNKYRKIRLWVDQNDSNSYLNLLYFCNEFYELIKEKEIKVVNIDNFHKNSLTMNDMLKNKIDERVVSLDEIKNYSKKWDNIVKINSDIRNVSNGIVKNLKYEYLARKALDIIKKLGRVNRMKAIVKLQNSDILNNNNPLIYNYIINRFITNGSVKEYLISDKLLSKYEKEDEYRNNEIEYDNSIRCCLVANIVDRRIYGENHIYKYGTKTFTPGTKVYVSPPQWGDGGDYRIVIGKARNKKNLVEAVVKRENMCNFRLQNIYSSRVIDKIALSKNYWWESRDKDWITNDAKDKNTDCLKNPKRVINVTKEEFLANLNKLHLSYEGFMRITKSLNLSDNLVIDYCRNKIKDQNCNIYRVGSKWYCEIDDIKIIVNVYSYEILSAKKQTFKNKT